MQPILQLTYSENSVQPMQIEMINGAAEQEFDRHVMDLRWTPADEHKEMNTAVPQV